MRMADRMRYSGYLGMFNERNISDRRRKLFVTIFLFVIPDGRHNVEQFFERNEAAVMGDLVIVHGICELGNFWPSRSVAVTKLAAFSPGRS